MNHSTFAYYYIARYIISSCAIYIIITPMYIIVAPVTSRLWSKTTRNILTSYLEIFDVCSEYSRVSVVHVNILYHDAVC